MCMRRWSSTALVGRDLLVLTALFMVSLGGAEDGFCEHSERINSYSWMPSPALTLVSQHSPLEYIADIERLETDAVPATGSSLMQSVRRQRRLSWLEEPDLKEDVNNDETSNGNAASTAVDEDGKMVGGGNPPSTRSAMESPTSEIDSAEIDLYQALLSPPTLQGRLTEDTGDMMSPVGVDSTESVETAILSAEASSASLLAGVQQHESEASHADVTHNGMSESRMILLLDEVLRVNKDVQNKPEVQLGLLVIFMVFLLMAVCVFQPLFAKRATAILGVSLKNIKKQPDEFLAQLAVTGTTTLGTQNESTVIVPETGGCALLVPVRGSVACASDSFEITDLRGNVVFVVTVILDEHFWLSRLSGADMSLKAKRGQRLRVTAAVSNEVLADCRLVNASAGVCSEDELFSIERPNGEPLGTLASDWSTETRERQTSDRYTLTAVSGRKLHFPTETSASWIVADDSGQFQAWATLQHGGSRTLPDHYMVTLAPFTDVTLLLCGVLCLELLGSKTSRNAGIADPPSMACPEQTGVQTSETPQQSGSLMLLPGTDCTHRLPSCSAAEQVCAEAMQVAFQTSH